MRRKITHETLSRINAILAAEMGLSFSENRLGDLERGIRAACPSLGFDEPDDCFQRLIRSELSREQIELLASELTIGETYFFREPLSFEALEREVLPSLIEQRRKTTRILRFWSAGCSSGEEAYSISILLQRLIPDWRDWNITVLATDINPNVLRKAERGIYRPWSFRRNGPELRERYFRSVDGNSWEIRPQVRELVRFAYLNLADPESYPSMATNTSAIDVIFCRNVLMYFSAEGIRQVGSRLGEALMEGGWLILSPSEASRQYFPTLQPVNFPGAIFFRKMRGWRSHHERPFLPDEGETVLPEKRAEPPAGEALFVAAAPSEPGGADQDLSAAAGEKFRQGDFADSAGLLQRHLQQRPGDREALFLLIRSLANAGRLPEALDRCASALAADRLDVSLHYLQAGIQQEMGDLAGAARTLRGVLFLEPDFAMAHFSLGNLLHGMGRSREAQRHLRRADRLLGTLADDEVPPEGESLTAARLRQIITANLKAWESTE